MTTTKKKMHEIELKLLLTLEGYERLKTLLPARSDARRQVNTFYDDDLGTLRQNYWALRLRLDASDWYLTAKGPGKTHKGITDREEFECECPKPQVKSLHSGEASLKSIDLAPTLVLMEQFGDLPLKPWMSFENNRQDLMWEECVLELDHSTCCGEDRYELECEMEMQSLKKMRKSLEAWLIQESIDFREAKDGKLTWAIATTQNAQSSPS